MKTTQCTSLSGLVAIGALCAIAGSANAQVLLAPIAFTGTSGPLGPGLGSGVTFSGFQPPLQAPSINAAGQVGFRGITSAGTVHGTYLHSSGSNSNLAIAGGSVPGGGTFNSGSNVFSTVNVNANGDWAFRGNGTTAGFIASNGGTAGRVTVIGDVAPGTGPSPSQSTTFSSSGIGLLNNSGQVAVVSGLTNSATSVPATVSTAGIANNSGLWIGTPGSMSLALRQNDTVSVIDAGGAARLGAFNTNTIAFNHAGRFIVQNTLQGTVTSGTGVGSNNIAILSNRSGTIEKIARVGDSVPDASGNPTTDVYRSFSNVGMGFNNTGRVVIQATTRDAAGTQTSTGSLFSDAGTGILRQVVRAGGAIPSMIGEVAGEFAGVTWGNPGNSPAINGNDTVVFNAALTGAPAGFTNILVTMSNVSGVDTFTRIARSGDAIAPNVLLNNFNSVGATAINGLGQLAFQATLTGSAVTSASDNALFGWDPSAGLIVIAREGDVLATPFGSKTISSFGSMSPIGTGGEDGRTSNLARNGKFAFTVVFTDSSEAVYVTTIPAPSALALAGFAGLIATRRRRSR